MGIKEYKIEWAIKNKEYLKEYRANYYLNNKSKKKKYQREYEKKNNLKVAIYAKSYYEKNKDILKNYKKQYYQKNKETINKKSIHFLKNNINAKLSSYLRRRLIKAVKNNFKAGSAVRELGCSIDFLKQYLESKFQPGMSWDNYGLRGWHIDHIVPLASFDLGSKQDFLKACHYTNLQPLWAAENYSKGAKCPEK
jgi:hypothetical protein